MSKTRQLYRWVWASALLSLVGTSCAKKQPPAPTEVSVTVVERIPKGADAARKQAPTKPTVAAGSPEDMARRYQIPVSESQPSQGPEDALITVVTWCDFTSDVCRQADAPLNAIFEQYKGKMRWVFRHLPAKKEDFPRHLFAQAAHRNGAKFWQARARLLAAPADAPFDAQTIESLARGLKMDAENLTKDLQRYTMHVGADIRFADQFGVARPFGVFVNGRRLAPDVPATELGSALKLLIDEELATAEKLVHAGTPKAALYSALTEDGYWGLADDPEARAAMQAEAAKTADAGEGTLSVAVAPEKPQNATEGAKQSAAQKP